MPCQDTPGAKFTYTAKVTVPAEFTVVMSAIRDEPASAVASGLYTYSQRGPIPVPSPRHAPAWVRGVRGPPPLTEKAT